MKKNMVNRRIDGVLTVATEDEVRPLNVKGQGEQSVAKKPSRAAKAKAAVTGAVSRLGSFSLRRNYSKIDSAVASDTTAYGASGQGKTAPTK